MKFGEFPVYDALGIELTHPVKCQEKTLEKGHILTSSDIGELKYAGIKTVVGVQFSAEDIHPETAADILLKTMAGDYLRYTAPDENGYSEIFVMASFNVSAIMAGPNNRKFAINCPLYTG